MENRITGIMIYYYFVCKRKLWYFTHEISMETENENVMLGKLLDENSYQRDDKQGHKELHEIKKSRAIEEAGIWQVKYYLYYLKQRGVEGLKAKIDYPLLKKNRMVELAEEDEKRLEEIIGEINELRERTQPPQFCAQKICPKCAYHDLCFI